MPLAQFRTTSDPALHRAFADDIFHRVSQDPRHVDMVKDFKAQLVFWLQGNPIDGESILTSLEFGRVVLKSFHDRTHAFIFGDSVGSWSYSEKLNVDLPLDMARLEWNVDQKSAYAEQVFGTGAPVEIRKALDEEYPGRSELTHEELVAWLDSAVGTPLTNQD